MSVIAPAWTGGGVDPVTAVRICFLLDQSCPQKLLDPSRLYCLRQVTFNWNGLRPCSSGNEIVHRVGVVTQRCRNSLRYNSILTRQIHPTGLNRRASRRGFRPVYLHRITGSCSWGVEKVSGLENRRQTGSVLPPHDFMRRVLVQHEHVGLCV